MPFAQHRWSIFVSVLLALGTLHATAASAEERIFDKKFTVTPGGTLDIQTESGSVSVTGSDSNEVIVHAVLRGGRGPVEKFEISADSRNSGVEVRGRRTTSWWFDWSHIFGGGFDVKYTIQVPRNYHVQVRTSGGDIQLSNFNGRAHSRTSGGNVTVNSVNGDVQIQSSGGDVHAGQIVGDMRIGTSGGDVKVNDVKGPLDARTSGGDVRLAHIDGKLNVKTSGGDVDVDVVGMNRGVDLRTSGGDVTVALPKEFAAVVSAHTSGGGVKCDLPITLTAQSSRHHRSLEGVINSGSTPLTVQTSGGDIRIRERI